MLRWKIPQGKNRKKEGLSAQKQLMVVLHFIFRIEWVILINNRIIWAANYRVSYHSQFWSKYFSFISEGYRSHAFLHTKSYIPTSHLLLPNPCHPDYVRFWRALPPRPISETLLPISVSPSSPLWTKWNRWERVWEKAQSKNQWRCQQSPPLTIAWDGKAAEYTVEWLDSE